MIQPTIAAGASVSQAFVCCSGWIAAWLAPSFTIDQPGFHYCWGTVWLCVFEHLLYMCMNACISVHVCLEVYLREDFSWHDKMFRSNMSMNLCAHNITQSTTYQKIQESKQIEPGTTTTFHKATTHRTHIFDNKIKFQKIFQRNTMTFSKTECFLCSTFQERSFSKHINVSESMTFQKT